MTRTQLHFKNFDDDRDVMIYAGEIVAVRDAGDGILIIRVALDGYRVAADYAEVCTALKHLDGTTWGQ